MDWGVATTVPACEHKANADLVSVGFMSYLPKYESVEAVRGQIIRRARPLFPGYIFFALVDAWRSVFDSEYIRGVFRTVGGVPNYNLSPSQDAMVVRRHPETASGT